MDTRNPRDRIWINMHDTERLSLYYSRRSEKLVSRQNRITFAATAVLIVAIGLFQIEWEYAIELASGLLFIAGFCEAAIIHFRTGEDIKAARIKASLASEVAYQWRLLWIDQNPQ